jgi:hypothetical protein
MSIELIGEIRKSQTYASFKRVFESVQDRVKIEKNLEEVLALHATRTSRGLATRKERYNPHTLIDAGLNDMSARARMVELRVRVDLNLSSLREAMSAFSKHVMTEYSEELREYKTAEQRRAFVDRISKQARKLLAEGDALIQTIDALVKDIDQSGHSMRHAIECLKLLDGSKGGRVV